MTFLLSLSTFCRNMFACYLAFTFTGCAVLETRFYSKPEEHGEHYSGKSKINDGRTNQGLRSFENTLMPATFIDSLEGTVVEIRLKNEYTQVILGPPLIPIFPFKSGYGHPDNKKNILPDEKDDQLIVELTIKPGNNEVSFIPSFFFIKKQTTSDTDIKVASISNVQDLTLPVKCKYSQTWSIVFSQGVHVKELPRIFLTSLKVNDKQFYPNGIPFKIGKKSFYAPLSSING